MATKRRRGAAKQAVAKQEAARKRSAPGKRFVGETARQSARAKQAERKKVARMARGARAAQRAEAARTAGERPRPEPRDEAARANGAWAPAEGGGQAEAAFRAAEEDAAVSGAEVEPLDRPLASVSHLPSHGERDAARPSDVEGPAGVTAPDPWTTTPSEDVSRQHGGAHAGDASPALGSALGGIVRSGLGLARAVAAVPLRIALAVPRMVLRAVLS